MKKTITISLGGMVFCLEDEAFQQLENYLKRLEKRFSGNSDRREIMNDIEARMAEHFKDKYPDSDMVININEVNRVVEIMGEPSDFESDEANKSFSNRSRKRLFRDPENRILGGVSSGIGYYWNIDPLIIRILFFVTALWGGGGLFVYIILWIVLPEAHTAAERLEMTGEPVTAENIGKSFQGTKE
jgi:phage shock protein PspC (stress-responsive transcriptional regulator)